MPLTRRSIERALVGLMLALPLAVLQVPGHAQAPGGDVELLNLFREFAADNPDLDRAARPYMTQMRDGQVINPLTFVRAGNYHAVVACQDRYCDGISLNLFKDPGPAIDGRRTALFGDNPDKLGGFGTTLTFTLHADTNVPSQIRLGACSFEPC
jgi:hypothetical protein